jgi:hypothetical protein
MYLNTFKKTLNQKKRSVHLVLYNQAHSKITLISSIRLSVGA